MTIVPARPQPPRAPGPGPGNRPPEPPPEQDNLSPTLTVWSLHSPPLCRRWSPRRPTCPLQPPALSSDCHSRCESDLDLVSVQLPGTGSGSGRKRAAPDLPRASRVLALLGAGPLPANPALTVPGHSELGGGERGVRVPPLGTRVAWRNNSLPGPSRCCPRLEEAVGGGGAAETPVPREGLMGGGRGRGLLFWRWWCLQTGAAPPFCCLSRESSERKKERHRNS